MSKTDIRDSTLGKLTISLSNHQTELVVIRMKAINPDVSPEKRERLKARIKELETVVIPRIERERTRCVQ